MIKVIGLHLNKLFKALLIAIVFLFGLSACENEDYNSQESLIGTRWGKAILNGEMELDGLDCYSKDNYWYYELKYYSGNDIVHYLIVFENDVEITEFTLKEPYISSHEETYNEYLNAKSYGEYKEYTLDEIISLCEKYAKKW